MVELKEVKMRLKSVITLIEKYRYKATYTTHGMSRSWATDPIPCTDLEILKFVQKLANKEDKAELIISNIDWEEFGNCTGDELYPVYMDAVKLPDDRYFITISEYNPYSINNTYVIEYILKL